jgi:cell wall-associated NlpC family hydrolase
VKRSLLVLLTLSVALQASFFVVIDKKGNVLEKKELTPCHNAYLRQSATEYSYQAIFDELHKEEHMALLAQAAKEHIERISREKEAAKKRGEAYRLSTADQAQLIKDAHYFKGGKYVWGGTTPEGFDCSGYVQYLFKKHKIDLPRTAWSQSKLGEKVELTELKTGDLLFFNTDKKRGIPVSHVGIYIGNGNFIHAASRKKGITVSALAGHYRECFVIAKRIIAPNTAAKKIAALR